VDAGTVKPCMYLCSQLITATLSLRLTRITTGQSTIAPYVNQALTAIQMAGTIIFDLWTASSMRYIITLTKPFLKLSSSPLTQLGLAAPVSLIKRIPRKKPLSEKHTASDLLIL